MLEGQPAGKESRLPGDLRGRLAGGDAVGEQRGSGHSVVTSYSDREDMTGNVGSNFPGAHGAAMLDDVTKATANDAPSEYVRVSASTSPGGGRPWLTDFVRAEARTGLGKADRPES